MENSNQHGLRDPNTLSNYNEWRTHHVSKDLTIDFESKRVFGTCSIDLSRQLSDSTSIVLDTNSLDVSDIEIAGQKAEWCFGAKTEHYGRSLTIRVPEHLSKQDLLRLTIAYSTTSGCTALQWLEPSQTDSTKFPYMFSQCEAIHARSLYPCQDTPDVKATFELNITSVLPVMASGIPTSISTSESGLVQKTYSFRQDIPIPSYLFALASGEVESASIGPRSTVYASPNMIAASKWELEEHTEHFIQTAEKLLPPYVWGQFNVLILPASFPYGGMENPTITFANPTIISYDRQNINVIAHELSHSWSGNLVTSASWEHFWLNEGWTTYLERRIEGALHGEQYADFAFIIGWKDLRGIVEQLGQDHDSTKLIIDHKGKDPDELFSIVPYEKGAVFLRYLERVVGRKQWDEFIVHYFTKFKAKSIDSFQFKQEVNDYFATKEDSKIETVDWDEWFYKPGYPPQPNWDTTLSDACYVLSDKWESLAKNPDQRPRTWVPSSADITSMVANQIVVFLENLLDSSTKFPPALVEEMGRVYDFASSRNVEVSCRYCVLGLRAKSEALYAPTADLLSRVGRMKFVRRLYASLAECNEAYAMKTYQQNKGFYHPICKALIEKMLYGGLKGSG